MRFEVGELLSGGEGYTWAVWDTLQPESRGPVVRCRTEDIADYTAGLLQYAYEQAALKPRGEVGREFKRVFRRG